MANLSDIQKIMDVVLDTLHNETKVLVGVHLKRIELLSKQGQLDPELYKELSKEIIWEHYRTLKKILEAKTLPSITFVDKE